MTIERREHRYSIRFDGQAERIVMATPEGLLKALQKRWPKTMQAKRRYRILDLTACEKWGLE